MHKKLVIAILLVIIAASSDATGAAARAKRTIATIVAHLFPASTPRMSSSKEAPTMMEAFLAHHYASESTEAIKKDMFEWLGDPKNVSLLDMLQQEQELTKAPQDAPDKAAYCVFYHAHEGPYRILQDFNRSVLQFEQQQNLDGFIPMRFWHGCLADSDITKFFIEIFVPLGENDYAPKIARHLLSANLSFLGNMNLTSSSSAHLYKDNESLSVRNPEPIIQKICSYYDFDTKRLEKIIGDAKDSLARRSEGIRSVLQIFMPRRYVDRVTYLSQVGGIPYWDNLGFEGYSKIRHSRGLLASRAIQTKITPIIDSIRSGKFMQHVESFMKKDKYRQLDPLIMNELQARIVLGSDVMLNPYSGVKIFRYDQLAPAQARENQQIMDNACRDMFIDWLERIQKKSVNPEALARVIKDKTPLSKLIQDDKRVRELLETLRTEAKAEAVVEQIEKRKQKPQAKL